MNREMNGIPANRTIGHSSQLSDSIYTDRSQETNDPLLETILKDSISGGNGGDGTKIANDYFCVRLHKLLSDVEQYEQGDIISWQPHGRCFMLHDEKEFEKSLLPKTFNKMSKLASFKRQLSNYGFRRLKTGRDKGGYYHEYFLRAKLFLCYRIKSMKVKHTSSRHSSPTLSEPDFYEMRFLPPVSEEIAREKYTEDKKNTAMERTDANKPTVRTRLEGNATRRESAAVIEEDEGTSDTMPQLVGSLAKPPVVRTGVPQEAINLPQRKRTFMISSDDLGPPHLPASAPVDATAATTNAKGISFQQQQKSQRQQERQQQRQPKESSLSLSSRSPSPGFNHYTMQDYFPAKADTLTPIIDVSMKLELNSSCTQSQQDSNTSNEDTDSAIDFHAWAMEKEKDFMHFVGQKQQQQEQQQHHHQQQQQRQQQQQQDHRQQHPLQQQRQHSQDLPIFNYPEARLPFSTGDDTSMSLTEYNRLLFDESNESTIARTSSFNEEDQIKQR